MILVNVPQRPAESLIPSPEIDRFVYLVTARGGRRPDCLCEGSPFSVFHMVLRGNERKALGYSCPVSSSKITNPRLPWWPRVEKIASYENVLHGKIFGEFTFSESIFMCLYLIPQAHRGFSKFASEFFRDVVFSQ